MAKRIFIFLLLVTVGCTDVIIPEYPQQIVVEGWIEEGRAPIVMVTTTVPVSTERQELESLEKNVVRWATVSVSDGEKEVYLTGRRNNDYFPPYIYTTAMMSGKAGKTYSLRVKYSGMVVEAKTTIPQPHWLQHIRAEKSGDGDGYVIVAGLKDRPETKDWYRFFVRVAGKDSVYTSSFLSLVDDVVLADGVNEIQVFNAFNPSTLETEGTDMYFKEGDKVGVKLCTMDEEAYQYWEDFDDVASLSLNPFFPVMKKIRSNIQGGLGYWAGYGSSYYSVECK